MREVTMVLALTAAGLAVIGIVMSVKSMRK